MTSTKPGALAGKRALVTGASSGLGAHFAVLLAAHGAEVVIAARRMDSLADVARRVEAHGVARCLRLDVTDAASRQELAAAAGPIDILVNNAGVVRETPALSHSEDDWDAVLDTNLKGMFFLAQALAPGMRERGGGSIINVASILGLRQAAGVVSYAVSKAGVIQLTQALALEWARHGIRVNALAPGYMETELNRHFWQSEAGQALIKRIPQRRLGQLHELDGPLLLLASDASRYMTGAVLAVDGGHLVSTL
ncbi:SDR family NAD(P)-dependent oxidoreductase [Pelomonas aquatica]|jgi:NAD(P)-dependent dehydrogenase (short-subunit alcohol dehydrogenase family)|uniref:Glucose 1-dehydrogenase n=1 Tax=Pelomonas aquatica TaxID=431058 RepID=A0A9X4LJC6_9BURK|nr:glucose 1-dehydrogenase [Pelomonas aquatica]MCY4757157.1 glucose 1-dehydrogenase [Pelomonas aquatica]MDG0864592.1 glucose 1-dehydrogenase [Pelomonas aquatica]